MKRSAVHRKLTKNGNRHGGGARHMSLAPVVYEWRKPHFPGKPGYYTLKSFHTLGCFPSGLEAPYRLNDFHKYYLNAYLPEEMEDWLDEVRPLPIEQATASLKQLREELQSFTLVTPTRWQPKPMLASLSRITEPMEDVLNVFMTENIHRPEPRMYEFVAKPQEKHRRIKIPNSITRHILNNNYNELTDVVGLLDETWELIGSTPHRRSLLQESQTAGVPSLETTESTKQDQTVHELTQSATTHHRLLCDANGQAYRGWLPPNAQKAIQTTVDNSLGQPKPTPSDLFRTPSADVTYEDELLLLQLHNLVSRAARETKEHDVGIALSQMSLHSLAHDDTRAAKVHGDLASLWFDKGDYETAIIHAQRGVLLGEYGQDAPQMQRIAEKGQKKPQLALLEHEADRETQENVVNTGYAVWSLSLAQQDHLDDALYIAAKAAEAYPANQKARSNLGKLQRFACGRVAAPQKRRSVRCYSEDRIRRAVSRMPFKLVHRSVVNRSTGHQWMFWTHPAGLKYKYDPRGF